MNKIYLVKFGRKVDSARAVSSESEAYDLIVDVIKNKRQIHHPTQGSGMARDRARHGDVLIIEYEIGSLKKPRKILGGTKAWAKEIEARGCSYNEWMWV